MEKLEQYQQGRRSEQFGRKTCRFVGLLHGIIKKKKFLKVDLFSTHVLNLFYGPTTVASTRMTLKLPVRLLGKQTTLRNREIILER